MPYLSLFILIGVLVVAAVVLGLLRGNAGGGTEQKKQYQYKKRDFFLSRAEHQCYDALIAAVGDEYLVFAQVHLPTLVDHKVTGQNWLGAFRHISEKSVDFVLCDKAYISAKLAIELDDKTHERPERQERDREVERILQDAGVPLLRLENHGYFNPSELVQQIKDAVIKSSVE
jgi:very-short-patch-repair endonuclease